MTLQCLAFHYCKLATGVDWRCQSDEGHKGPHQVAEEHEKAHEWAWVESPRVAAAARSAEVKP